MTIVRSPPDGARSRSGGGSVGAGVGVREPAGSVVAVSTSTRMRPVPRSPATSDVRNDENFGPRSTTIADGCSPGRIPWIMSGTGETGSVASSASASKRTTMRLPSWETVCGVAGADFEREPGERSERLDAPGEARDADVAGQQQPRRFPELDADSERRRKRARHEIDGHEPRAAVAHRRGAGSETRRPPTDASPWPGDSTIVCPLDEIVMPPAAVSSRTLSSNRRARSSSGNIS